MILTKKNFKNELLIEEYQSAPFVLKMLIDDFCIISKIFGIDAVCVRIYGKIPGDSGVHLDERAADFRNEFCGSHLYSDEQVFIIKKCLNRKYHRIDGHKACVYHSFKKGPKHFHLQIPRDIKSLRII